MYNDFMSIEALATFAGLTAAVSVIVQFTKSIFKKKFGDSVVRIYTFIIAIILTFLFARTGKGIESIALTVINAVLIAIASMGGYEVISDPKAIKSK